MLEVSLVNLNSGKQKYSSLRKKNVAFKNQPVGLNPVKQPAPSQTAQAPNSGLKNLVNIIPNSYVDEVAAVALIAGLTALNMGKGKKLNKVIADNTKLNEKLTELSGKIEDYGKKATSMGAEEVKKLISEQTGDVVKRGELDQKFVDKGNELATNVKTAMGIEADAKIARQTSELAARIGNIDTFPRKTVEVNGQNFNLATMINPIRHTDAAQKITPEYQAFTDELHAQSTLSVLGLRKYSKPTSATPFVRMVAVELKPFTSVGGLSTIPKEMAEELPKILNQAENPPRIILDTPLYKGCIGRPKSENIYVDVVKDAVGDGYTYIQKEGQKVTKHKLSLIDEMDVSLVGEKNQHVRLFQTEPILSKASEFSEDTRKLFKPELLQQIDTKLAEGTPFETDSYKIYRQDGKDFFQAKLTYNLWDNEKFNMEIPQDRVPNIYTDEAFHSGLMGRMAYFSKYIYEHTIHMMQNNESGQCMKNGKAVLGADAFVLNDWHTGPLAALLRLGTVAKKHQHSLRPDVAEKVTNVPVISLLHNIYDQKTGDKAQVEKMLNIMFGQDAAEVVPHAYMPNTSINQKGGLPMYLANGCMSEGNTLSPLNMLAMYSDSMHPVSDGYAKECASMAERGKEFVPLFHLRTKEDMTAEQIRTIAANNGVVAKDFTDEQLMRSTFYGIDNGLNKVNNIMTSSDLTALQKEGFNGEFRALSNEVTATPEAALAWHDGNKKSAITHFVDAVNSATGREKSGKLNAWLGDTTDLTGVTEKTPVFTTAGRITEQKGYETYMGGIVEYVKTLPKDDPNYDFPVFITQGELAKNSPYAMSVVKLIENTKQELTQAGYKKAADRIVLLDRGDGAKYTMTKLVTDMDVMSSNYEPCGLTHKEFMNKAGGLTVGNMTGGIPSGLPDTTIVKVPFDPKADQATKSHNFALGIKEAIDRYNDKNQFAKAMQDSLNLDFTWAKEGNSGSKYVDALASKGVFDSFK